MNRHQFEERIKEQLQEQQFTPQEDLWLKLKADLPVNDTRHAKTVIFFTAKIAAGIAILIAASVLTVHFLTVNKAKEMTPLMVKQQPITKPGRIKITTTQNIQQTHIATQNNKANKHIAKDQNPAMEQYNSLYPKAKKTANTPVIVNTNAQPFPSDNKLNSMLPAITENNGNNVSNAIRQQQPVDRSMDLYAGNNNSKSKAIHIGMMASVGSSTISNVGYQVGMVGRGRLSETFFVEAGLTVASNTVNSSNDYSFPGLSLSGNGIENTSFNTSTDIKADYTRNVISVGFSPAMGVKAGKRLAFSAGGSVYRNLNPSLALHNENEIDPNALNNNIINTTQKVTNWDVGLNGNAEYKVTKQLSFNVNYRKGLTDYLQQGNKQLKNSGLQLGLKFLFDKQ